MTDFSVREIITRKLKKTQTIPGSSGEIYYYKSLNLHRCVLVMDLSKAASVSPDEIRGIVTKNQRSSWFRGMGFGVFLTVDSVEKVASDFEQAIDTRSRGKGTWQWTILHSPGHEKCSGYHTWTHGYISDLFQDILRNFHEKGFQVTDQKARMGEFQKFATSWTAQGRLIKQYQEIFLPGTNGPV